MSAFTYAPKPNAEPKTCTNLILFFSVSVAEFQQTRQVFFYKIYTFITTCVVYNLVIMKAIDGLSSETIVRIFYKRILLTTQICGTIPRATINTTNLMQWHGTICIVKVFLLSEREISPNYTGIFLHFVHGFRSYVKGLPKTKRCNSVAVTVSVRIRCICEAALRGKM